MSTHTIRTTRQPLPEIEAESALPWQTTLLILGSAIAGASVALLVMPYWLPFLLSDVSQQQAAWHLARSSGVIAYLLLWLSTLLGISITSRLARLWPGGPTAFDLHQFSSLFSVAFAMFHALILLGDHYIGYTLSQLALPFAATSYRPISTGWGQLGIYLGLILSLSFYVRSRIGRKAWRLIHFASFLMYVLVTVHGVLSGSDTSILWPLYFSSITSILCLTLYRIFIHTKS